MKPPEEQLGVPSKRKTRRSGFTLLELSVCLVILGLLSGTAVMSLSGVQRNVDLDTWSERFVQFDQRTRQRAQAQGQPWQLILDLQAQTIHSTPTLGSASPGNSDADTQGGSTLLPPTGWTLVTVRTGDDQDEFAGSSTTHQAVVLYSTHGVTPTYAVQLRNQHEQVRWLLVAGVSGQWTLTDHDDHHSIDNLFAALR